MLWSPNHLVKLVTNSFPGAEAIPVVSDPPAPQQVLLTAGEHTLSIDATTNDPLYHFGAFYQFGLTFEEAP